MSQWRLAFEKAAVSKYSDDPALFAVIDTSQRFGIPLDVLRSILDGIEMDLSDVRYETFADLKLYCERVASMVGIACIHIWGFTENKALDLARTAGYAFQMINILRDLREDAARGRLYVPQDDLRRFNYSETDLAMGICDDRFKAFLYFQTDLVERLLHESARLDHFLARDGRRIWKALVGAYKSLLAEIKKHPDRVAAGRIRIPHWRKLLCLAGAILP